MSEDEYMEYALRRMGYDGNFDNKEPILEKTTSNSPINHRVLINHRLPINRPLILIFTTLPQG